MADDRSPRENLDFADEMQSLAREAQARSAGGGGGGSSRTDRAELLQAVGQLVRPLAQEIENIKRGNSEMSLMLTALGKAINAQQATPLALEGISQQLQRFGSVENANQKLFDAMHGELKGYKDNFLFDALQKPFIRDLVSLFDDFSSVHDALETRLRALRAATPGGSDEITFLQAQAGNVENQLHHMIEVFLRMEVELSKTPAGAPVDKRTHRTMSFEPAATEAEDGLVARSIRPGFTWRERAIRAEEIVAKRWKPAPAAEATPAAEQAPAAAKSVATPPAA